MSTVSKVKSPSGLITKPETSPDKNAKNDLAQKVNGLRTDTEGNLQGYKLSLNAAFKEQDEYAKECK